MAQHVCWRSLEGARPGRGRVFLAYKGGTMQTELGFKSSLVRLQPANAATPFSLFIALLAVSRCQALVRLRPAHVRGVSVGRAMHGRLLSDRQQRVQGTSRLAAHALCHATLSCGLVLGLLLRLLLLHLAQVVAMAVLFVRCAHADERCGRDKEPVPQEAGDIDDDADGWHVGLRVANHDDGPQQANR
eukprot:200836-Chlamydomonas_euryale.AAC.3